MTNFIEINSLIVHKSDYRDCITPSRLSKTGYITQKIYLNIDKINNYYYPTHHSYYYREYKQGSEANYEYVSLQIFEVKMDNGDIYFIEKEYFEEFVSQIDKINKERYVKNINITYPVVSESKKRKKK